MGTSSGPGESGTLPGGGALCIESTKEATSSLDKSGARQEVVVQQRSGCEGWRQEGARQSDLGLAEGRGPEEEMNEEEVRCRSGMRK